VAFPSLPAQPDADRLKEVVLDGADAVALDELEEPEERDDGVFDRLLPFEVVQEVDGLLGRQDGQEVLDLALEGDVLALDRPGALGLLAFEDAGEGRRQVEEGDLQEFEVPGRAGAEEPPSISGARPPPCPAAGAGGLDLLVFDEPVDEEAARVLALGEVRLHGQEHLGLDK
jgi:hypothetical protein